MNEQHPQPQPEHRTDPVGPEASGVAQVGPVADAPATPPTSSPTGSQTGAPTAVPPGPPYAPYGTGEHRTPPSFGPAAGAGVPAGPAFPQGPGTPHPVPPYAGPLQPAYGGGAWPPYGAVLPPTPARPRRRATAAVVAGALLLTGALGVGVGLTAGRGSVQSPVVAGAAGFGAESGSGAVVVPDPGSNGSGSTGGTDGSGTTGDESTAGTTTASAAQRKGLVYITTSLGYQNAAAAGTGLVLTADGTVLTNNHVVEGATSISVQDATTGKRYTATVVGTAPTLDIAVLKLADASGLSTVTTDTQEQVAVGDAVVGVGNAGGTNDASAAAGTVTALDQTITATDEGGSNAETLHGLIQTDAAIRSGDSGGALYDDDTEVVGINTAASVTQTGVTTGQPAQSYAIPISDALAVVQKIEAGEESTTIHLGYPAFLGVSVSAQATTAQVVGVVQGGPAETAGIAVGDTITKVGGKDVTAASLRDVLSSMDPGDRTTVTWTDQAGQSHTATVTLVKGPVD